VFFIKNRTRGMAGKQTKKRNREEKEMCEGGRERRVDVEERFEPPLLRLRAMSNKRPGKREVPE
jgi:hypothetical protein